MSCYYIHSSQYTELRSCCTYQAYCLFINVYCGIRALICWNLKKLTVETGNIIQISEITAWTGFFFDTGITLGFEKWVWFCAKRSEASLSQTFDMLVYYRHTIYIQICLQIFETFKSISYADIKFVILSSEQ